MNFGDEKDLDLENLWKTYSIIKKDYYDLDGIKKQSLITGATKGLVESLGDKHSEYFSKKDNEEFEKMLSGDFEGIGAVVDKLDFGVKIERVLKGSPAEKFGLRNEDVITEANNEKLDKLTLVEAVSKIKGPAGTKVLLKILRTGEKEALEIEVIRGKIKIPSVEEKYFEKENIGYIALNIFGEETASEFKKSLNNLSEKKIDGLIIDLRNNGGGYLLSAVEILSEFIKRGDLLVTTKYKNKIFNEPYFSTNIGGVFDKKIIILINESSASASEITAGALREYDKAILVGEKTYGKGSVQKPFNLDDGSMVKLTIAKWFTPKDKNIDGEGIEADIKVKIEKQDYDLEECIKVGKCDENLEQKDFEIYDRQLEEAKTILKSFIKKGTLQVVIDEENERLGNVVEEKNIEEKK
ncbi:MAG: S41 family peptidase [Candidatus Gracilibacteria bacterium]|nr:S41 family peptidase [Candidatus Gracilibacteria bacterium]